MKKLRLPILVFILFSAVSVTAVASIPEDAPVYFSAVKPVFSAGTSATLLTQAIHPNALYTEEERTWEVAVQGQEQGRLAMTTAVLPSGTLYYFLRYEPKGWSPEPIVLIVPIELQDDFTYRTITYPDGFDFVKSVWSEAMQGEAGTALPKETAFIEESNRSMLIGYIDVYEKQESEVRKERYELGKAVLPTREGLVITLPQVSNSIVETWGFVGAKPLFDWESSTAVDLRMGDFNRVRKWTREGMLVATPSTYSPTSPRSFWLNPTNAVGEKFLRTQGSQIFEDFALVSLYASLRWQNDKGYWYTSPTSLWLNGDYGIGRYFYDTRFNTDQALFLLKGYNRYQDPRLLASSEEYARYLLDHIEARHFLMDNGGYLVSDYAFDVKPDIKTHASLNHQLAEMNYLLELYKTTSNEEYLIAAEKLRDGVIATAPHWENEAGDLHYAYLPDGTYGMKDYPLLTLKDLRYSQALFEQVYGERHPVFDTLIQIKEAYLREQGLPLY